MNIIMVRCVVWLQKHMCLKTIIFMMLLYIYHVYFSNRITDGGMKVSVIFARCISGLQPLPRVHPAVRETIIQDVASVEAWRKERETLLSKDDTRKVLLFSHMRGGSTIGGEVFNQDSTAIMWYEIADAFYMAYYGISEENLSQHDLYYSNGTRRVFSTDEQHSLTEFFTNQLTCQYDLLPPETMAHHFLLSSKAFADYTSCLGPNIGKDRIIAQCVRYIAPLCGNTVETSLTEKCHIILKYTRDVFTENANGIASMKQSLNQTTNRMPSSFVQILVDKLLQKLKDSEEFFDPRLLYKLKWFIYHKLCIEDIRESNQMCLSMAITKCHQSTIHVLQINRMKMEEVDLLLKKNPDLHVVYYVRDPRAIAVSRSNTKHMVKDITDIRPITEAYHVCHKMATDLEQFYLLQSKYPGAFQLVNYENLVRDPVGTANLMYSLFGKESSPEWVAFAQRTMHVFGNDPENYVLKDAAANLVRWRKDVAYDELNAMNNYCGPLLQALGYDIN